jgi:hypothetical protein
VAVAFDFAEVGFTVACVDGDSVKDQVDSLGPGDRDEPGRSAAGTQPKFGRAAGSRPFLIRWRGSVGMTSDDAGVLSCRADVGAAADAVPREAGGLWLVAVGWSGADVDQRLGLGVLLIAPVWTERARMRARPCGWGRSGSWQGPG